MPLGVAQPGPNGLKNSGGGGNPVTLQKHSGVVVCTWNVTVPPVTGYAWVVGVTEETQEAVPWVKVMSACPLTTITAVRGAPVKFASVKKETEAPNGPPAEPEACSHGAVLDVIRLDGSDGHEPVAVSGNTPDVAHGAVRIVGYGADRVQPACANASTGAISIRSTAPQKTAREVCLIIG